MKSSEYFSLIVICTTILTQCVTGNNCNTTSCEDTRPEYDETRGLVIFIVSLVIITLSVVLYFLIQKKLTSDQISIENNWNGSEELPLNLSSTSEELSLILSTSETD